MEDLKIKSKVEEKISRRSFLKKAAYVAPVVVTLGALTAPMTAQASTFVHHTQSVPATDPITYVKTQTIETQNGTNNVLSGQSTNIPAGGQGEYVTDGAYVKTRADAGDATWTWVNTDVFHSSAWNGIAAP